MLLLKLWAGVRVGAWMGGKFICTYCGGGVGCGVDMTEDGCVAGPWEEFSENELHSLKVEELFEFGDEINPQGVLIKKAELNVGLG
jgi:hypothetical protein